MPAQGRIQKKRKRGGGEGGAELRLDCDRYFVPMKYCLRFEEETSIHTLTLPLGCRASTAVSRLSFHHPASRFKLQSELVSHLRKMGAFPVPAAKLKVDLFAI